MADYHSEDLDILLENVSELEGPGYPGMLSIYGENAFAVLTSKYGDTNYAIVAASRLGDGKVLIFSHDGYVSPPADSKENLKTFLVNSVKWASNGVGAPNVGIFGPYFKNLADVLEANDISPEELQLNQLRDENKVANHQVIFLQRTTQLTSAEISALQNFVQNGGGLIVGATGWAYGDDIRKYPANLLTGKAGLFFTNRSGVSGTGNVVNREILEDINVSQGYDSMIQQIRSFESLPEAKGKEIIARFGDLFTVIPSDDQTFLPKAAADMAELGRRVPFFNLQLPLEDPSLKLIVKIDCAVRAINYLHSGAHPASQEFPGRISPDTPRLKDHLVEVDVKAQAWYSTGLYAPAGEVIRVEIIPPAKPAKLHLRIGTHKDDTSDHPAWARCPNITLDANVAKINPGKSTEIACSFGGLLYICSENDDIVGTVQAKVSGAVASPYFVLGKTTKDEWNTTIKNLDTPWSELECKNVILTLPTDAVRKVDDPESLLNQWIKMVDSEDDFGGFKRIRPERYCADVDIGGSGYMHSGYPIMIHKDGTIQAALSVEKLRSGDDKTWGLLHELGHNHQETAWTFDGTGEVTNNVFVLFTMETLNGIDAAGARPDHFGPDTFKKEIQKYVDGGKNFNTWKNEPFLALKFYYQLKLNFGWDAFKKTFRAYQTLPVSEKPKNDQEKMDKWLTMFSRTVGVNLSKLFVSWGIPTTESDRNSLNDLPSTEQTIESLLK